MILTAATWTCSTELDTTEALVPSVIGDEVIHDQVCGRYNRVCLENGTVDSHVALSDQVPLLSQICVLVQLEVGQSLQFDGSNHSGWVHTWWGGESTGISLETADFVTLTLHFIHGDGGFPGVSPGWVTHITVCGCVGNPLLWSL